MKSIGIIMLNGDPIGGFDIVEAGPEKEEHLIFEFDRGSAGIRESLEFATEQGMIFSLQLKPDFDKA